MREPLPEAPLSPARPPAPPAWARHQGADHHGVFADLSVGGVTQRLRWIPPGRFTMGSPETEAGRLPDEGPQRLITLTYGFWLGETPVSQALWQAVMGENPSHFRDPARPVERVSWDDTQRFFECLKLHHGFAAGLPTEAQWEYACRAGTQTATWLGDLETLEEDEPTPLLDGIAWHLGNSADGFDLDPGLAGALGGGRWRHLPPAGTCKVGLKAPNPLGLRDMLGNVWEWCHDRWPSPYAGAVLTDPVGPPDGEGRAHRGGSWRGTPRGLRAAFRGGDTPKLRSPFLGFRLARSAP